MVKEGGKGEHFYPNYEGIRNSNFSVWCLKSGNGNSCKEASAKSHKTKDGENRKIIEADSRRFT
jgi:hypothetical protein